MVINLSFIMAESSPPPSSPNKDERSSPLSRVRETIADIAAECCSRGVEPQRVVSERIREIVSSSGATHHSGGAAALSSLFAVGSTPSTLLSYIRLAREAPSSDRAAILKTLLESCKVKGFLGGPDAYFYHLGGEGSGIRLALSQDNNEWPFSSQYAIVADIKSAASSLRSGGESAINLFKITNANHNGIIISIVGNDLYGYKVVVEVGDERSGRDIARASIPRALFSSHSWHQIAISHHAGRRFGKGGTVRMFVDGVNFWTGTLQYPRPSGSVASATLLEDFRGLSGPTYVLADKAACASPAFQSSLAILSRATYRTVCGSGETVDPATRVGISNAPRFWAVLDPRRASSATKECHGVHLGQRTAKLASVVPFRLMSLQGSFRGVGGILRSVMPFMLTFASASGDSSRDKASCLALSIELIAHLLRKHLPTQQEALESGIVPLISAALENVPEDILAEACRGDPPPLMRAINEWVASTTAAPATTSQKKSALKRSDAFQAKRDAAVRNLEASFDADVLFNMRIWAKAGLAQCPDMLSSMLRLMEDRVRQRPALYRARIGVQRLLDSLRHLYLEAIGAGVMGDVSSGDATPRRIDGEPRSPMSTPSPSLARAVNPLWVRRQAMRIVLMAYHMLRRSVSEQEFCAVVCFMIGAGKGAGGLTSSVTGSWSRLDIELAHDTLVLMFGLLSHKNTPPKDLIAHCAAAGKGSGLACMLAANIVSQAGVGERVRAAALGVTAQYLCMDVAGERGKKFRPFGGIVLGGDHPRYAMEEFADNGGFQYIYAALVKMLRNFSGGKAAPMLIPSPITSRRKGGAADSPIFAARSRLSESVQSREHISRMESNAGERIYNAMLDMLLTPMQGTGENSESPEMRSRKTVVGVKASNWAMQTYIDELDRAIKEDASHNPGGASFSKLLDDTQHIHSAQALELLVKILPKLTLYLQQKALQDLFLLLKFKEQNRRALQTVRYWQAHLLLVLGTMYRASDAEPASKMCFDMGVKLVVMILSDAMQRHAKGYMQVDHCLALRRVAPNGDSVVLHVLVCLCEDLAKSVRRRYELAEFSGDGGDDASIRNVCILGMLIEDILFQNASSLELDLALCSLRKYIGKHESMSGPAEAAGPSTPKRGSRGPSLGFFAKKLIGAYLQLVDLMLWKNPKQTRGMLSLMGGATPIPFGYTLLRFNMFLVDESFRRKEYCDGESDVSASTPEESVTNATRLFHLIPHLPPCGTDDKSVPSAVPPRDPLGRTFSQVVATMKRELSGSGDVVVESSLSEEDGFVMADVPAIDPQECDSSGALSLQWSFDAQVLGGHHAWGIALLCCVHRVLAKLRDCIFAPKSKSAIPAQLANVLGGAIRAIYKRYSSLLEVAMEGGMHLAHLDAALESALERSSAASDESAETLSWLYNPWLLLNAVSPGPFAALCKISEHLHARRDIVERSRSACWSKYLENEAKWAETQDTFATAVRASEQELAYNELNRIAGLEANRDNRIRPLVIKWGELIADKFDKRSVWWDGVFRSKWMLSEHEDAMRRRVLKKVNVAFSDHRLANYYSNKEKGKILVDEEDDGDQKDAAGEDSDVPEKSRGQSRLLRRSHSMLSSTSGASSKSLGRRHSAPVAIDEPIALEDLSKMGLKPINDPSMAIEMDEEGRGEEIDEEGGGDLEPVELNPVVAKDESEQDASEPSPSISSLWSNTLMERQYAFEKGEKLIHVSDESQWVTPLEVTNGRFELTTIHLYFYSDESSGEAYDSETYGGDWVSAGEDRPRPRRSQRSLASDKSMMRWRLDELSMVYGRRYLLRATALELFFVSRKNIFIAFKNPEERRVFFRVLNKLNTPQLQLGGSSLDPKTNFGISGLMEDWCNRKISNFEYIMQLNTFAGRSYNDITQYPVFPWVLADYTSDDIDLSDPSVYRDLSKPVGALNPERLESILERFECFGDADVPPFHYGSHYSSAGVVLHYMLRLEPFTTMAIDLQGGRFDCPDRLFFSVAECWRGCNTSMSDVKELIPEFFYEPEIFINRCGFDFGRRQDSDEIVDHVELPPWAKGSASEFVRINREALESDYVSAHLHEWVDLIFGYKQRGPEALKAHNLFYYLTYEGAVDLDAIEDPVRRHAVASQIFHFGNTPALLLRKPHPKRKGGSDKGSIANLLLKKPSSACRPSMLSKIERMSLRGREFRAETNSKTPDSRKKKKAHRSMTSPNLKKPSRDALMVCAVNVQGEKGDSRDSKSKGLLGFGLGSWIKSLGSEDPKTPPTQQISVQTQQPIVSITTFQDRLVLIRRNRTYSVNKWTAFKRDGGLTYTEEGSYPFSVKLSPQKRIRPHVQSPSNASMFAAAAGGKFVLSVGYPDFSLRVEHVENPKIRAASIGHRSAVNCVALSEDGTVIVTGSDDATCCVWELGGAHDVRDEMIDIFGAPELLASPGTIFGAIDLLTLEKRLWGNSCPVTSVAVSTVLGIAVSGGSDGSVVMHSLYDDVSIVLGNLGGHVRLLKIAPLSSQILAHSEGTLTLFSVVGDVAANVSTQEKINDALIISEKGNELCLTAGALGCIVVRRMSDLSVLRFIPPPSSVRPGGMKCLALTKDGRFLLGGTADGKVVVVMGRDQVKRRVKNMSSSQLILSVGGV